MSNFTADPVQQFYAAPKSYCKPKLVQHTWIEITGISLPIGTSGLGDFLEQGTDYLEEQP